MMLARTEFIDYFKGLDSRINGNDPQCPLWIPENKEITCRWFVCVKPLAVHTYKTDYYSWCNSVLKGQVRCFSTNNEEQQEWWGFTDKEDMAVWMLKWM